MNEAIKAKILEMVDQLLPSPTFDEANVTTSTYAQISITIERSNTSSVVADATLTIGGIVTERDARHKRLQSTAVDA